MEEYKFSPKDSQIIVNAIVEGYREYIEHRKDRHKKMKISSAFAWTKGNFIESKLADIGDTIDLIYRKSKAGLTWDYLQFIHEDKKILFLIKNAAYFNENSFSQAKLPDKNKRKGPRRTYLHELSKVNIALKFKRNTQTSEGLLETNEQLSLFVSEQVVLDELEHIKKTYNEFHILTYKIDDAFQISDIIHYLPNPNDNIAYEIENLSQYISGVELTNEEKEILAPEQYPGIVDPAEFDIGIFEEEEEN